MQIFIDISTQKIWQFENDVKIIQIGDTYSFTDARGVALSVPATLQPYVIPTPTLAQLLADAKTSQNALLTNSCAKTIIGGFQSSALGAAHTYASKSIDQANLQGAAIAASSAPAGWQTPIWCANASGNWTLTQHTGPQAVQAHTDLMAMISAARVRLAALKASLATETTVAAVQAITW